MLFLTLLVATAVAAWAVTSSGEPLGDPEVGVAAPDFTLTDTNGETHTLSAYQGRYVVLEWLNFGCPFVGKHYDSGNMQALQAQAADDDVVWLSIVSSAPGKQGHYPPDEMNQQMASRDGAPTAILMDEDGTVGRLYGARTTPHMYIVSPDGALVYKGAIDDKPTTNQADVEMAENYVVAALTAHRAGEPIAVASSQPYGCTVKY